MTIKFDTLIKKLKNLVNPNLNSQVINTQDLVKPITQKRKSTYVRITDHVYFDGHTFRVRFIKNGIKHSKYFKTRKEALKYKKNTLSNFGFN